MVREKDCDDYCKELGVWWWMKDQYLFTIQCSHSPLNSNSPTLTDVSGGYSCSIMDAMRTAVASSHAIGFSQPEGYQTLSHHEAFFMATLGGARGQLTGRDFSASLQSYQGCKLCRGCIPLGRIGGLQH